MVYELREYTAVPGRSLALIERFNRHTIRLLGKHGMDLVFIGRTAFGEDSVNELVYMLRFDDYAELEAKWAAFLQDPEWQKVKAESEVDGPLVQSVRRRLIDPSVFKTRDTQQ